MRIKIKANKDDEPEENAEPQIQATACGQATGEAVPAGARMQPLSLDPGEGGDITGSYGEGYNYEGPQLCTSQWGYDYICSWTRPWLSLSVTSLTLPQTFINQQSQASFVIWNSGGGTLTGTVSVPAPFSVVSGASFNLLPGQPHEVVVRFSSANPGSFSRNVSISSNGGNATVSATSVAHKISFSPAQVDFGSTLVTNRVEQVCRPSMVPGQQICEEQEVYRAVAVERALTVRNEGTTSVTLKLRAAVPYKLAGGVTPVATADPNVSEGILTLSAGQSAQVLVKFDPTESGNFTGAVQVGIQEGQGSVTAPLTGVAHKIEIDPEELDFGIAFVGSTRERKLTITNKGTTTVTLEVTNLISVGPFYIEVLRNPFTLQPGQSTVKDTDITVRFNPLREGTFSTSVHLVSGSVKKEVRISGTAYAFEKLLKALGTLFVPGNPSLFFDGFEDIEGYTLASFQNLAQVLLARQPQQLQPPSPEDLEIARALEELKAWLDDPAFEQKIQELVQQYPAFRTFVEILNAGFGNPNRS